MTARSLARYLRVVLACVALALVCPAAATTAPAAIDASAWVAEVPSDQVEAPARPDVHISRIVRNGLEPATHAPGAARASVIQSRLYIRHEALLC